MICPSGAPWSCTHGVQPRGVRVEIALTTQIRLGKKGGKLGLDSRHRDWRGVWLRILCQPAESGGDFAIARADIGRAWRRPHSSTKTQSRRSQKRSPLLNWNCLLSIWQHDTGAVYRFSTISRSTIQLGMRPAHHSVK